MFSCYKATITDVVNKHMYIDGIVHGKGEDYLYHSQGLLLPSIWDIKYITMHWNTMRIVGETLVTIIEVEVTVGFASRFIDEEMIWSSGLFCGSMTPCVDVDIMQACIHDSFGSVGDQAETRNIGAGLCMAGS